MTPDRFLRRLRAELRFSGLAAWRALVRVLFSNDLTHAASIAYYSLLSLFPFLLLVISILGLVTSDEGDRNAVLGFVFRYFPAQFDFISNQLDALRQARIQVGVAGGLALIWGSLGVFGALTSAVNEAWRVETPRGFWKHRLVSFLMLVAAGGLTVVALATVSAAKMVQATWFGSVVMRWEWLAAPQTLALRYLATLLLIGGLGLVYYFIPNTKTRFRDVWFGAIVTGVLWHWAFAGFSWYVAHSGQMRLIHGSIATVVVFLLWIYFSAIILMYGVEFTASHARLRRRIDPPALPPPSPE